MKKSYNKLILTIDNISDAQALAIIKTFQYMEILGKVGASRKCTIFADGDGDFHPKISYDYPIELPEIEKDVGCPGSYDSERKIWKDIPNWNIDHDPIALRIYHP